MNQRVTTARIRIISAFILITGCLLMVRLYVIQVQYSDYYRERAERQYVRNGTNLYSRGSIFFTTKDGEKVSAASIKSGYLVAVTPSLVTDKDAYFNALEPYLDQDRETFIERIGSLDRSYVEIINNIDQDTANQIEELALPGVTVYRDQWRYYPGGDVSARTIGFIGYTDDSPNELRGKYGLERYYDNVLARDHSGLSVNIFAEIFSNLKPTVFESEDSKIGDIVTTIEPTVARMLDRVLMDTQKKYDSTLTGGVVMDPKTGEIFALNTVPTYDLNDRAGVDVAQFRNPLVENVYEMGSIIKPLTVAAGLDAGVITPSSTYYDAGFLEVDGYTIRNYDGRGRGTVPMQEVLNQSLNTGASHIATLLGKERFRDYFLKLRLGSESGIDLPNEAQGLVSNLQSPREVEYATASFGQGIAMTPIVTARALAALGNGGYMITPHLVSSIEYEDGTSKKVNYPLGEQVFSAETSETISRMLTIVVDEALKGGSVAFPNHTMAAKTGTAQIADPKGGYYDDRYLHSFFGYVPAFDPQFLVFLYTVEPKNVPYASQTLTDPFIDLSKFLINYYNIPPDR